MCDNKFQIISGRFFPTTTKTVYTQTNIFFGRLGPRHFQAERTLFILSTSYIFNYSATNAVGHMRQICFYLMWSLWNFWIPSAHSSLFYDFCFHSLFRFCFHKHSFAKFIYNKSSGDLRAFVENKIAVERRQKEAEIKMNGVRTPHWTRIRFQDDRHIQLFRFMIRTIFLHIFIVNLPESSCASLHRRIGPQWAMPITKMVRCRMGARMHGLHVCNFRLKFDDVCCVSDDETFPNLINVCIVSSHCLTE